jgi:hypothetical protein
VSALLVLPITAVLHHLVFFRGMCMLNKIGDDYTLTTVRRWLSIDPSLPLGIAIALVILVAGLYWKWVRTLAAPGVIATIPLVLWVWDIPFTGRIICDSFHDGRLRIGDSTVVTTAWVYIASAIVYVLLLLYRERKSPAINPATMP